MEQRAAPEGIGGRSVLEHVVMEMCEHLPHLDIAAATIAPVLHGLQLAAQVMEPHDVGVGPVGVPVVAAHIGEEKRESQVRQRR